VLLANLQTNYSFNRFLTLTSLIQIDTSDTQAISANFRLRYNYRPDSDLYLIYTLERNSRVLPRRIPRRFERHASP